MSTTDGINRSILTKWREIIDQRVITVDILAMLFGIGSWIGVNSVYQQLPLIVPSAPEGWTLPSYLAVIVQSGNVGPLIYHIVQTYSSTRLNDVYLIYAVKTMACIAAICMAFFYQSTAIIGGEAHSVALLGIAFFFALVGCTSSVLFMPYMGRFHAVYLVTYMVGEGLSGFYTSILSLIQGVGGVHECIPTNQTNNVTGEIVFEEFIPPPRFGSELFFILVATMMLISAVAFTLLNQLPLCSAERAPGTVSDGNDYSYKKEHRETEQFVHDAADQMKDLGEENCYEKQGTQQQPYTYLLILMGMVSLIGSGIFPGIQSFSCMPYGRRAYHLSVTLSSIANPVACMLAIFFNHTSHKYITALTALATAVGIYLFGTALMSPTPWLVNSLAGEILVVSLP